MKCKLNVAVMIIAMCLITTATHAQSSNLRVRFRVPFPFTVENATFAAGEYEVTQQAHFILAFRNVENQSVVYEHVQPAGSRKKADVRARADFHRYGGAYFLAVISDGSRQSTYDLDRSRKEVELADQSPTRQPEVVSALSNGTVVAGDIGRE
jgi:hypothetical protein